MSIVTRPATDEYRKGWEAAFGKKSPSCACRTPGVGIQRNTCLSPMRAVCQCVCHYEAPQK